MLRALELRDFAIVDELRLEFVPGLNALTGETGAGKSILVDALSLLVGQRADNSLIRSGSHSALAQGEFEGAVIASASRRLQAGGRGAARVDGELVTVAELATRAGAVIAVHGQHASQSLGQPDEPRRQLDRLLDDEQSEILDTYRARHGELADAERNLADLRAGSRERQRRLDTLRFELDEIDAAGLDADEEARLRQRAESLRHGERIVQGVGRAVAAVGEGERNALTLLAGAARDLDDAARHDPRLVPLAAELHDARSAVQATGAELEAFLADFDVDPRELDLIQERLARIEALERKYGEDVAAVLDYRNAAAAELAALEGADLDAAALERRVERLRDEVAAAGRRLQEARQAAARRLGPEVEGHLRELGMPGATFTVIFEPLPAPGPHGTHRVDFVFGANPGEPPQELGTIASGGELSRVMLALNVVTGSDRPVLVFDEVDAGVGGRAARAVGSLLKRLSRRHQVLVVTHLPQVAAFADSQYYVEKRSRAGRTVSVATRLDPHEREQEIARMLSGAVTEASLRNARELVAESERG